ncbi:MAG: site-specific integrase [Acidobacteria bacterium]|nr:site-specific integrase [Acidobacteriota bacterium]
MYDGKRWRMRVDDFALAREAREPITVKQTAEKVWEPRFLAEIIAGRDPRVPPNVPKAAQALTVADFLDRYFTSYVEAEGLRTAGTIKGRLNAVKACLGDRPVSVLEKPSEILRFKAAYRPAHEIATVNRALSTLRAAINWGRFQDPPFLTSSPFHRFGVTIKTKDETKRDRRVGLQEEKQLLDAALSMNSAEHRWVGSSMHDRLIGALETCCRQGEMLRIQNRHIDWDQHQIAIPGAHAKAAENRRIPFDPQGRLAPILKRRAKLGPNTYVFGTESGEFQKSFKTAWEALLLVANGYETKRLKPGLWVQRDRERLRQIDLHWHDLRHEGACRLLADAVDIRTIQLMLGHSDIKQTQRYLNITDEELRKAMTGVWERRRQLRAVNQDPRK